MMEFKKVIVYNVNKAYKKLYDLVLATEIYPNLAKEKGYSERGILENTTEYFERLLKENNIPNNPYVEEVCELVHVNYDTFSCVVLCEDGSFLNKKLGDIKVLKEQE